MFDAYIAYHARVQPRTLAFLAPGRRASYAELDADVNRYAAALAAAGISPASGVVAIRMADWYRHHVVLCALARLGVATTPAIDPRPDFRIVEGRAGASESDNRTLTLDPPWIAAIEAADPVPVPSAARDPEGVARVLLTSGTTKLSRRVPLTWRRVEIGGLNTVAVFGAGKSGLWIPRTGIDTAQGFSMSTVAWSLGATVAAAFADHDIPMLIERFEPGLLGVTPVQLREMLRSLPAGFTPEPGLRIIVTGSLIPPALAREARLRLTPDILVSYGSTEGGRATTGPAALIEQTTGAVGYAVPGARIEVVDENGASVPPGELGEIRVISERSSKGYLDDPEATAQVFRDGWIYAGDLGRLMPDGLLVVEGRIDDRMNLGGVKTLPAEYENAALEHPLVRDAALFAIPGERGVDEPWLAIVAEEGLTREVLDEHMRARRRRLPALRIAWTEQIPRNAMGKIDRQGLRAQTEAALERND